MARKTITMLEKNERISKIEREFKKWIRDHPTYPKKLRIAAFDRIADQYRDKA